MLLGAGAVIRLTRLVTWDTLTQRLRDKVNTEAIECSWCVSVWVGLLVAVGWWWMDHDLWTVGCAVLGWSEIAGRMLDDV